MTSAAEKFAAAFTDARRFWDDKLQEEVERNQHIHAAISDMEQRVAKLNLQELPECITDVSFDSGSRLCFYGTVDSFMASENAVLMDFLETLESTFGDQFTSHDFPEYNCRVYLLDKVHITITPREAGTCQRVQVGTITTPVSKMVQEYVDTPVYAFKC